MLKSTNLSIQMTIGSMPIPRNTEIIGATGVVDDNNGNSGVLIRHKETGIYQLFGAFGAHSVDQRAARKYAEAQR